MSSTLEGYGGTVRERILRGAAQEFAELGFDGARVDSIAGRANVGKAMVYYHIGDKACLYETVLSNSLDRARVILEQPPTPEEGPQDQLRRFVKAIVTTATEDPHFAPLLLREVAAGGVNLPVSVIAKIGSVFQAIRRVLEEGQADGEFRAFDPLTIHALIGGSVMFLSGSAALRRRLAELGAVPAETSASPAQMVEQIADLFLYGLTSQRTGERIASLGRPAAHRRTSKASRTRRTTATAKES